jgi:hypothetical protein
MSNPLITVQDQFIAALSVINGTGIYENNIKKVYQDLQVKVPEHPSLAVAFDRDQEFSIMDAQATAFDFDMNFGIACYLKVNTDISNSGIMRKAQYSLAADVLRAIRATGRHLTDTVVWNVRENVPLKMSSVYTLKPADENTVVFGIYGHIHVRNLNADLT